MSDVDVDVKGLEQLDRVMAAIKDGDKELRKGFYRALSSEAKPLAGVVKDDLGSFMPAAYAAELEPTLKISPRPKGGANPALSMRATAKARSGKRRELGKLEHGELKHPLYGNRKFFFPQEVEPGFWTTPLTEQSADVAPALLAVVEEFARQVANAP